MTTGPNVRRHIIYYWIILIFLDMPNVMYSGLVYSWTATEQSEWSASRLQQMQIVLPAAKSGSSCRSVCDVDVARPPAVSHMSTTVHSGQLSDRLFRSSIHFLIFAAASLGESIESCMLFLYFAS